MEKIRHFYEHIIENAHKLNDAYTLTKIGEEEGHNIMHNLAKLSWPLSNRSSIVCQYIFEHDGTFTFITSSKGNEHLVEANKARIGKDVVANAIINYSKYTPYEHGFDIVSVSCADPAGSVPDVLKNR